MPTETLSREEHPVSRAQPIRTRLSSAGLSLQHVSKRFESVQALADLSFSVERGRMLGFLGPNGAGKTTAMRAVFGLVQIDGGDVLWDGRPVQLEERLRFGYMPEERGLYPRMPVREQLEYFGQLHGLEASAARLAAATWLERLGLAERGEAKLEELSHGNQQRAQLAAALVHEPELLVLDEPFAGTRPARCPHARRCSARRGGPRGGRGFLEPSTRARRGHLRGRRDHRPRPDRGDGNGGRAEAWLPAAANRARARGRVDDMATHNRGRRAAPAP